MAPEQLAGQTVTPKTDIYALGAVLFEMASGKRWCDLMFSEVDSEQFIRERNPDLPPGLERVLLKALAFDPQQRFSTISDMVNEFDRVVEAGRSVREASTEVGPVTSRKRGEKKASSKKIYLLWGFVPVLIFLLGLGFFVWKNEMSKNSISSPTLTTATTAVLMHSSTPQPQAYSAEKDATKTVSADPIVASDTLMKKEDFENLSLSPGESKEPRIVIDTRGNLHVIWKEQVDPDHWSILHRWRSQSGSWSETQSIINNMALITQVSDYYLMTNSQGEACTLWQVNKSGAKNELFSACGFESLGQAQGTGAVLSLTRNNLSMQYAASGKIETVFANYGKTLMFNDKSLSQGFQQIPNLIFRIDQTGIYHVVWAEGTTTHTVYHRFSRDAGATWSEADILNDPSADQAVTGLNFEVDAAGQGHLIFRQMQKLYYRQWSQEQGWSSLQLVSEITPTINWIILRVTPSGSPHILLASPVEILSIHLTRTGWSAPEMIYKPQTNNDNLIQDISAVSSDAGWNLAWRNFAKPAEIYFGELKW